jgi:pyridoxamine 5'-phosphate oxidase
MPNIADIRKTYALFSLNEKDAAKTPVLQFNKWWDAAVKSNIDDVNAMTLSTVTDKGSPAARIVLLKGYDESGFVFFTNYESQKGNELLNNEQACLSFYWKELQRQVRIDGTVSKLTDEENDTYFHSRPEGSQMGAWASPQSRVIKSREVIEANFLKYEKKFNGKIIPRPPHWGGYRVHPQVVEFWQGRENRLHDRILYSLQKNRQWKIQRLAP